MASVLRLLRPTLAAWGLAFVARALLGCSSEAAAEPTPPPDADTKPAVDTSKATAPDAAPLTPPPVTAAQRTVTLSAIGDCTLGQPAGTERAVGGFHKVFDASGGDLGRPFSLVKDELAKDDLTIANLETTLTTESCRTDLPFAFRGRPEFAKMLTLGSVELVTLANNHSGDCGPRGLAETKKSLEAAGVGYFGLGKADVRTLNGIEVVNLGYTGGRDEIRDAVAADVAKHKKPDNLVIVSFHWGIEEEHATNGVQLKLGHAAIDAGADLVLGHHPHVLQGMEEYKGKRIVYSLGNFVFGGHGNPDDITSMIYRARFELRDGRVEPSVEETIPVHITGVKAQNDFRPLIVTGAEADAIRGNLARWSAALR